jgi:hypothetical protein
MMKENMIKLEHPCFPQPDNPKERIWRYLDLAKLIWQLENSQLYLSRLDMLNDPHEGSIPSLLASIRDEEFRRISDGKLDVQFPLINQQLRKSMYVSCWRLGNYESEAMWRLYCPGNDGVAIQTTYELLLESISHDPGLYIGCVNYIDYQTGYFPLNNAYYPVMHKRISFSHEREVRIVKSVMKNTAKPDVPSQIGISVDWDLDKFTENLYVNPYSPEYYFDTVKAVLARFDSTLLDNLYWSKMRSEPVY